MGRESFQAPTASQFLTHAWPCNAVSGSVHCCWLLAWEGKVLVKRPERVGDWAVNGRQVCHAMRQAGLGSTDKRPHTHASAQSTQDTSFDRLTAQLTLTNSLLSQLLSVLHQLLTPAEVRAPAMLLCAMLQPCCGLCQTIA